LSDEERSRSLMRAVRTRTDTSTFGHCGTVHRLTAGALLGLTRDMVDYETGTIYLEKTKNGTRHALPLVEEALTLVRQRCEQLKGQT